MCNKHAQRSLGNRHSLIYYAAGGEDNGARAWMASDYADSQPQPKAEAAHGFYKDEHEGEYDSKGEGRMRHEGHYKHDEEDRYEHRSCDGA
jgi:hypothetical protein